MKAINGTKLVLLGAVSTMVSFGVMTLYPETCEAARVLTLAEALELAAQHSPIIHASRQAVEAAEAQRTIARSAFFPKVEASETWTSTNNPTLVFGTLLNQGRFTQADFNTVKLNSPSALENWRSAISVTQPVYNGGRAGIGVSMAEIGRSLSAQELDHARQRVFFMVSRAYYDLLLAKSTMAVARETIQIAEANVRSIASRFKGGTVVKSDLLQAQVRLAAHREEGIRAEQAVRIAGITLRHAIGLDEPVDAKGPFTVGAAKVPEVRTLVARALESRPDYRKQATDVRKAEEAVRLARSTYLPTFNLQASYELNNTAPFSENGSNNYVALGVVSLNLFNGLGDVARVRKAKAEQQKARMLLAAKRREVEVEVVEAYYGLAAARERLAVTDSAVAQGEENLRIMRNRYKGGISPVIDLLTAELVLNQAKQNRIHALYDEHVGRARLWFVTGQLDRAPQ